MRVLVVGAGLAGLTLALCLDRRGHDALLVERAPRLRDAGYMIDFFGSGYDAAERLGLLPQLESIHYPIPKLDFVGEDGRVRIALSYPEVRRVFGDRHFNFMRGELERVLAARIEGVVPIRFGATINGLRQEAAEIVAELTDGTTERADLLVGADGVHSLVRSLVFGESKHRALVRAPEPRAAGGARCRPPPVLDGDRPVDHEAADLRGERNPGSLRTELPDGRRH